MKSPRLQGYDYTRSGAYFVTICTHERQMLFGQIADNGVMILNAAGTIAEQFWVTIPDHFPHIETDLFVVMPNHVHGILLLTDMTDSTRTRHCRVPTEQPKTEAFGLPVKGSLSTVVRSYKSIVTREIRRATQSQIVVWQGRYHDHVIRNEHDLNQIREYIVNNPAKWREDILYAES
jgi:REP element-mobilizing transposase RayT